MPETRPPIDLKGISLAVLEEARVLRREEGLHHHVGDLLPAHEDPSLDRVARDGGAVRPADLRDDVGAIRGQLGDARDPDRARDGVPGRDAQPGGEDDREKEDQDREGSASRQAAECSHD